MYLPFVVFVKSIAPWFGLGNVIKNLERFQGFRKQALQGEVQMGAANRITTNGSSSSASGVEASSSNRLA